MSDAEITRLVTAHAERMAATRQAVLAFIERAWGSLTAWRSDDIDRFVAAVVPIVEGGQLQIASLTDTYLASVESTLFGTTIRPVGVPAKLVKDAAMRGVSTAEVYARTGPVVWRALKDGADLPTAVSRGLGRALSMASTDLQLAKTHAGKHVMSTKPRILGYRRVLTGSKSCGLCIVASTERYRKRDLLPIHPGCDCGVLPIYEGKDIVHVADPKRLTGVHDAINQRFGAFDSGARDIPGVTHPSGDPLQYRDVLVTHEHGEIGPVLGVRGQHFTGPTGL